MSLPGVGVNQRAKKVVSDSPGLVDFAIGLVMFVLNLPDEQVLFFWRNSNYRRIVINPAIQKGVAPGALLSAPFR